MKKNFKKYLSYALGVVLAMGLGLSYAYAVGANDSNAFVTTTEWEQRVAQIEASLDNVSKTISDTSMDFMMNGPRLQASLTDGFENIGCWTGIQLFNSYDGVYRSSTLNSTSGRQWTSNMVNLIDQIDGTQSIREPYFWNADSNTGMIMLRCRFAVQSTDPNVYLVVSMYGNGSVSSSAPHYRGYQQQFVYYDLSNPYSDYSSSKTVTVKLPLSEWWPIYGDQPPSVLTSNSTSVYTGKTGADTAYNQFLWWNSGNSNSTYNLSNPGQGWVSRSVTETEVTYQFGFPAGANIIRDAKMNSSPWCVWDTLPIDMKGRKFGNAYDQLSNSYNTAVTERTARVVAKVYSPQKGCLALKSFYSGEIPILNE